MRVNPFIKNQIYTQYLAKLCGARFTPREVDILACLLQSRNYSKIAELLDGLSVRTVNTHIANIKAKLNGVAKENIVDMVDNSGRRKYFTEYYFQILDQG